MVLLAAVGWCMVQESIKQTQARYDLAELSRREEDARRRLDLVRAEEQELRSPARLAALVREKRLNLVFLGSAMPADAHTASARRPGQVQDETPAAAGRAADMASAGQW